MAWSALPLVAAHAGLLVTYDLAARPVLFLAFFAFAGWGLLRAVRRLGAAPAPRALPVLLVAALLRLLLLPLPPTLSDDALRYVWDGRVVAAGANPYLLTPEAPELVDLRDGLWEALPHRDVATVYPPLALALFSIAARLPAPVYALKLLLAMVDLATCAALLALAARLGVPRQRTLWYAWSPLAALEVAGMGHVDALGVGAAVGAVLLVARPEAAGRARAAAASAAAAAASVLAKLVPLAAVPAWARASRRPWLYLAVALGVSAALAAPVAVAAGGVPPGYLAYGVSWEFNGPLFEPLWRLLDRLEAPEAVAAALDRIKQRRGEHEFWNRFYPFNYPQLLAKLALGGALAVALPLVWRRREAVPATGAAFGVLLLLSATVYPWYLLWILPWAALCRQPAWLLLSITLPLSYLPQVTALPLVPWIYLAIWAPFGALLVARPRWSTG